MSHLVQSKESPHTKWYRITWCKVIPSHLTQNCVSSGLTQSCSESSDMVSSPLTQNCTKITDTKLRIKSPGTKYRVTYHESSIKHESLFQNSCIKYSNTGCSLNIVFFFRFLKNMLDSIFPRCQCVYTYRAGRNPALHQNWQSSEKSYKEKTQFLMNILYI